jgi:hypothetical protein
MDKKILRAALGAAFCVCLPLSGYARYRVCESKSASIQVTAVVERPLGFTLPESTDQQCEGVATDVTARGLVWVRYARPDGVVVQVDSGCVPVTRSSKLRVASAQWQGVEVLATEDSRSLVRIDTGIASGSLQPMTITVISTDN